MAEKLDPKDLVTSDTVAVFGEWEPVEPFARPA